MYTLRFPFTLPPGQAIHVTEKSAAIGDLNLTLTKEDRLYILRIVGFSSEEEAKNFTRNIWGGLMWLLLHRGLSPGAELKPQNITYAEDPHQAAKNLSENFGVQIEGSVDGLIDAASPAVYATGKRLRTVTMGEPSVTITTPAEDVFKYLSEGASFPKSRDIIEDQKLKVALELYGAYFTEFSANARFLTLVMAFEALASGVPRTQIVLNLLEKWNKQVEELDKTVKPDSDDSASLKSLRRELLFRREDSIRQQIRRLVFTTLQDNGDKDAATVARTAVKVYDLRSRLVHDGKLESQELSKATNDAKSIVERVLRGRFVRQASNRENQSDV
jgi:hypothetical protein